MRFAALTVTSLILMLGLAACSEARPQTALKATEPDITTAAQPSTATIAASPKYWAALLVAGDNSAPVFDNAVVRMKGLLTETNVIAMRTMSSDFTKAPPPDIATAAQMDQALAALPARPDTGCLVFVTSHGGRDGLLLTDDLDSDRMLTPGMLGRMLDARCGTRPTVAIVSACYSGIFVDQAMTTPNRIILTAARSDRTSFGCSADNEFTYYDSCLIENWQKAHSFRQLYDRSVLCVRAKEAKLDAKPSEPQAYFGSAIGDVPLPR
ncbi:MAG: C13 family peptidase [Dongiaceae bacterium]